MKLKLPTSKSFRVALLSVIFLIGCSLTSSQRNPFYNAEKPLKHHTPSGFLNNYTGPIDKGFWAVLQWRWEALTSGADRTPKSATPTTAADLAFINANAQAGAAQQPAITWLGHASVLVQAAGLNVMTDPMFSERASPVSFAGPKRAQPPGVALKDLPRVDVVIISHNHYDHLDLPSVKALAAQKGGSPLFLVPLGLKAWFAAQGMTHVIELDWWQHHEVKTPQGAAPARFTLTPVQHWSARGVFDRSHTLWGGWAITHPSFHWYFAGDTGYSADFTDTQAFFAKQGVAFDLALIPIGAYEPRWFMKQQHVDPTESVQMHQDLKAKQTLGIHWGTFDLTDEPIDQPPRDLAKVLTAKNISAQEFFTLAVGETRRVGERR